MPTVPSYQAQFQQQAAPRVRLSDAVPQGQEVSQALYGASDVVQSIYEQEQKKANDTALTNARTQLLTIGEKEIYDPQTGLITKKGSDVFGEQDKINERVDKNVSDISANLPNDVVRRQFNEVQLNWRKELDHQVNTYVVGQMDKYADDSAKAQLAMSTRTAARDASLNNFQGVQIEWGAQEGVLGAFADRKGLKGEARDSLLASHKSDFHKAMTEQLLSDGNVAQADNYFKANKSEIDTNDALTLDREINARRSRDSADNRVLVTEKLQDMNAMAKEGVVPPKGYLDPMLVAAAYPREPDKVEQVIRRSNETYAFAHAVGTLKNLPPDQLQDFATKAFDPKSGPLESFAENTARRAFLQEKAAQIQKERMENPVKYAKENNILDSTPIDWSNPQNASQSLRAREASAQQMTDRFGSPLILLEKEEAGALTRRLSESEGGYMSKINGLDLIRQSVKTNAAYNSIMQQIRPDSPVTGIIGNLIQLQHVKQDGTDTLPTVGVSNTTLDVPEVTGSVTSKSVQTDKTWFFGLAGKNEFMSAKDVAISMAMGERILNPSKGDKLTDGKPKPAMPDDSVSGGNSLRVQWNSYVGDAFRGAITTQDDYYQAFRNIYAKIAMNDNGNYTGVLDTAVAKKAAIMATGGIGSSVGSKKFFLPWGMDDSEFRARVSNMLPSLKDRSSSSINGWNFDLQSVPNPYNRNSDHNGWYQVTQGDGPVMDKNGQPIFIQVR